METRGAAYHLHVLLRAAVLERQLFPRERANHIQEEPAGNDSGARRRVGGGEPHPDTEFHIGRLKLGPAVLDA
jgi:hypothetical protein